jgi:hypothetical protein
MVTNTNTSSRFEFTPLETIQDHHFAKNSWSTYIGDCFRALCDAKRMGNYERFSDSPLVNYNLLKSLITSIGHLFSSKITPAGFVGSDTMIKFFQASNLKKKIQKMILSLKEN